MRDKPLSRMSARFLEWRARRIADPVRRLRYLRRATSMAPRSRRLRGWRRRGQTGLLCLFLLMLAVRTASDATAPGSPALAPTKPAPDEAVRDVWLVENNRQYEVYSNGLRIENDFLTAGERRSFTAFDRRLPGLPPGLWGTEPAGIVYHTTESHSAPFAADQNQVLRRVGESLLAFVREKRAYHFLIDRFGRVHRIVAESDAANHAGNSVWADARWVYVNLNSSFLGVAFEGQTEQSHAIITPAQIHAGKILTEMLRCRYHIRADNCVTHAQVSVNPDNLRIGYHTDWAGDFPFEEMGLADNYAEPVAGLYLFGFSYDPVFVKATGARLWKGLALAEEQLRQDAVLEGRPLAEYRHLLQKKYRDKVATLETKGDTT